MDEAKVRLELQQDTQTHATWVKVSVRCQIKNIWADMNIDADKPNLRSLIERAAEALALHLNIHHGENIDGKTTARAAVELLDELYDRAEAARGIQNK